MRRVKHVSLVATLATAALAIALLAGCTTMGKMGKSGMAESDTGMSDTGSTVSFTVRIEVLGGSVTPIAPVAWAVYTGQNPLFAPGTGRRIQGLEALAEDGDPAAVAQALSDSMTVAASGVADTPEGAAGPKHGKGRNGKRRAGLRVDRRLHVSTGGSGDQGDGLLGEQPRRRGSR